MTYIISVFSFMDHVFSFVPKKASTNPWSLGFASSSKSITLILIWWAFFLLFSHPVLSDCLQSHGVQHIKFPCPSPSPRVCSNSCPLSQWCHPTISSSLIPFFSCPQSFPTSGSFPISRLFTSGSQSIGASASVSVLPMNIQGWFPLGLTDLISLQSKGLSRVFSRTVIQRHQFFSAQPSLQSNFFMVTSVLDYWKNHCFDYMDLCRQSDVSAF